MTRDALSLAGSTTGLVLLMGTLCSGQDSALQAEKASALVPKQSAAHGCVQGSWDIADRWSSAYEAGRVYATAINLMTLEILGDEPAILKIKQ